MAPIVGSSYGGWVAMNAALFAPERVERLVLLSPANGLAPFEFSYAVHMLPSMLLPIRPLLARSVRPLFAQDPNPVYFEQLIVGADCPRDMVFPSEFTPEELRRIRQPTLLLVGTEEAITNPTMQIERVRTYLPRGEAELIPGAGHMLSLDRAELITQRIMAFVWP